MLTEQNEEWGNKVQATGTVAQYGFTGREPDATGLIYYRARYYDPTLGRFISRDPAGMPDGINRYAYVENDPVNLIDPSGLVDIYIHGTDVLGTLDRSPNAWWRGGTSQFSNAIRSMTHDQNQFGLEWSGGNDPQSRAEAANKLAGVVNGYLGAGEPVRMYAHSHAGNVVALASAQFSAPVDLLVTMGTPVRSDYNFDMSKIKKGIAISSPNDWVQTHGGNSTNVPLIGEMGSAGRQRGGFTNISSSGYDGHSAYHDNIGLTTSLIDRAGGFSTPLSTIGSQSITTFANPNLGRAGYSAGGASNLPYKFNF